MEPRILYVHKADIGRPQSPSPKLTGMSIGARTTALIMRSFNLSLRKRKLLK